MPKIKIDASQMSTRKDWSSAQAEFMRHCRIRNLSPHTLEYYGENLTYVQAILKLEYADELTKDKVDDLVVHEMDKGNKVGAINTRLLLITRYIWIEGSGSPKLRQFPGVLFSSRFCKRRRKSASLNISIMLECFSRVCYTVNGTVMVGAIFG